VVQEAKAIFECKLMHLLEASWKCADVLESLVDKLIAYYLEHVLVKVFKVHFSLLF
jgi:hypothetical protein